MCGGYVRKKGKRAIAETFNVPDVPEFAMPDEDYNIAPTTYQPIVRANRDTGEATLSARWGLFSFLH